MAEDKLGIKETKVKSNLDKVAEKVNPFGKKVDPAQREEQIGRVKQATDIRSIGLSDQKAQLSVGKALAQSLKETGTDFIQELSDENKKLIQEMVTQVGGLALKDAKRQEKYLDKILEMSEKIIEQGKKTGNEKLQKLGEKTQRSADEERARLKGMNLRGADDNYLNRGARNLFGVDMESKLKTNAKGREGYNQLEGAATEDWQKRHLKERGIEAQGIGWKKKDAEGKWRNITKDQLREEIKDVNNNTFEGKTRGIAKAAGRGTLNVLKESAKGFAKGLMQPFGYQGISNYVDPFKEKETLSSRHLTDEEKRDIDAAEKANPTIEQGKGKDKQLKAIDDSNPDEAGTTITNFGQEAISQLQSLFATLTKKEESNKQEVEDNSPKILDKDGNLLRPAQPKIVEKTNKSASVMAEADKSASETQEEAAGISTDPKIKLQEETNKKLDEIIRLLGQAHEEENKDDKDNKEEDQTDSGSSSFDPTDLIPDNGPRGRRRSLRGRARLARMKIKRVARGGFRAAKGLLGRAGRGILSLGSKALGAIGIGGGAAAAAEGLEAAGSVASVGSEAAEGVSAATKAAEGVSTATKAAEGVSAASKGGGVLSKVGGAIKGVAGKAGGLLSKGAGLLGKAGPGLMRGLGTVGRVAGKFAAPLAIAMSAYDAYKGWNADPNATTGQKFKNMGRNVLSGLTFGLVDSTEDKMASGEYSGTQKEAEAPAPAAAMASAPGSIKPAAGQVAGKSSGGMFSGITNFAKEHPLMTASAFGPLGLAAYGGKKLYDWASGSNETQSPEVASGQNKDAGILVTSSEEARDKMQINVPPPTVLTNNTGENASKTSPLPTSPITVRDDDSSWMRFTMKRAMA